MPEFLRDHPGRLFPLAAALPLAAFLVLLVIGFVRRARGRNHPGVADRVAGILAVGAMVVAVGLTGVGLSWHLQDAATFADMPATLESRWAERFDWIRIGADFPGTKPALALEVGYRVDRLTAVTATMVAVVGTLIFVFSMGYMRDELRPAVEDHVAHATRRGRYGRFFLYLSLFAFSMFTILLADNLFLAFVGWELVGVSSFFLIGFYTERPAAGAAANKAFVVNRIGDAGFLIGLAAAWAGFGSLNIQELGANFATADPWLATVIGLGLFAGCVGKSAQVPLHTWLPDAMEGPTPVSALIHAATMVAAGVYLAARCYLLFTPDVLLVVAYVGAVTLFLSAAVACVQTDIKRVLAFSTGSQLGYMMLALGLGGWTAATLHLITHAFFKALLFLAAGSVIHALHHEQDLRKMGGLRRKLPVTAFAMLVGVAAIIGFPLTSGWASKDLILAHVVGHAKHGGHALLFVLPAFTVLLTGYYMVRLWLLAFAGEPRDKHVYAHAHESPAVMTGPLVVLAVFSIAVAWGWPVWEPEAGWLAGVLKAGEPHTAALAAAHHAAHEAHYWALALGLAGAAVGAATAIVLHRRGGLAADGSGWLRRALLERLYFDRVYAVLVSRPVLATASAAGAFDKRPTDRPAPRFDAATLDGALVFAADAAGAAGASLAGVQTGRVRGYVAALGLTVAALLAMLWGLTR